MANRPKTAKPKDADGDDRDGRDAAASGEILPAIPAHLDFLFDDRPTLPEENEEHYDALLRSMIQQIKPVDVIEAMWVKNIVDLIWEAKRMRQWRGHILMQARLKAVEDFITPALKNADTTGVAMIAGPSADALAAGWVAGREIEKERVDGLLQDRGLSASDVPAHSFLLRLPDIERIDRLVSSADQRRDVLLREIERKRASFAQQVRTATADVLDVEHTETR